MTRGELQLAAVELIKHNNRLALQWCTGLGKSKTAIMIMNELGKYHSKYKVLLVVAETAHKDNWKKEFIKWGLQNYIDITIECYASLKNYRNTEWDLIIFDEAHHLGSELRLDTLTDIKADNVLLLSATLPDQIIQILSIIYGKFMLSKVSLKQAISWGILPKPKIYLIPLTLDSTIPNCIISEEWGRSNKRIIIHCSLKDRWVYLKNKIAYPNVTLLIQCTQQQKYDYLTEQFEYWRMRFFNTRNEAVKNKWLQAGSKRKRFLGESKTDIVKILLDNIKNKRYICFCSSIEQAEELGGNRAIHSKRTDSSNIIKQFDNKEINSLFAVGMLQEGQNLQDIEAGVITQLDGQERVFIQKFGRSLRAEDPIQFIFYYKNTRDEEYLNKALENVDREYVTTINNWDEIEL